MLVRGLVFPALCETNLKREGDVVLETAKATKVVVENFQEV